jgi:hypothetical protein
LHHDLHHLDWHACRRIAPYWLAPLVEQQPDLGELGHSHLVLNRNNAAHAHERLSSTAISACTARGASPARFSAKA